MKELKLTAKEQQDIVYDESDEYSVVETNITGTWRHGEEVECIVQRVSDQKYFLIYYIDSVKDSCEFLDMNYDDEFDEVVPVQKLVTVYERIK